MLAASAVLLLADSAASLLTPLLIGVVTAELLGHTHHTSFTLNQLLEVWAGLVIVQSLLRYASAQKLSEAAATLSSRLRSHIYDHIQALPVSFFHNREHGDILSLLSEDIQRVSMFITQMATRVGPHLLTVFGAAVIVLRIDPATGIAALCVVPLVVVAMRYTNRAARPLSRLVADRQAALSALTEENLRLNHLIKTFTREPLELERYQQRNNALLHSELRHLQINNRVEPLVNSITGIAVIVLVWIGALRIQAGDLSPSELVSLIMYGFLLFRPLSSIGQTYGSYQSAKGAAGRLTEILDEQREPEPTGRNKFPTPVAEIRLSQVGFAYPGQPDIFDGLSISFPVGKITALIGPNGAGKSTLAHLVMRFLTPQSGRISIDSTDIQHIDLDELRRSIGYVPQHVTLISGTIEDNLRYGVPEATQADVTNAAASSLVDEFSRHLPLGLQTHVGPGGVKLSGGQKQRIALGRALLKDAPVIILDEPTAMFDPRSEIELLRKLLDPLRGKTVIIITHRQAMLELADEIVEMSGRLGAH